MGRIVAQIFQSLDGYYAGPNGEFIPPEWSSDMERWSLDAMSQSEGFIYGRVNFEFNRDFWTQAQTDPDSDAAGISYADQMNAKPKTVFSRTLTGDPGW